MKTYKELYEFGKSKVADYSPQQRTLANDIFLCVAKEALTEHDQELIKMIDEMEEESGYYVDSNYKRGYKTALTEIRSKL